MIIAKEYKKEVDRNQFLKIYYNYNNFRLYVWEGVVIATKGKKAFGSRC